MAPSTCYASHPLAFSPGHSRMLSTLSSASTYIKAAPLHCKAAKKGRSARLTCFSYLDLQADPLLPGDENKLISPNGKDFCEYYGIHNYSGSTNRFGLSVWQVKDAIKKSGNFQGPNAEDYKRICIAVAMQEANLMDAHDPLKSGLAANHSIYNLSSDMLLNGGFSGNLDSLDPNLQHLSDATNCILAYLQGWAPYNIPKQTGQSTATSTLNFIRGGQSAYNNGGGDWYILMYRRAIRTMVDAMEADYTLMGDDRRIEIHVPYI